MIEAIGVPGSYIIGCMECAKVFRAQSADVKCPDCNPEEDGHAIQDPETEAGHESRGGGQE